MNDLTADEKERQRNWVELRAACDQQGVFDQLVDVIKCDVKRFNALAPEKRHSATFGHERRDRKTIGIGYKATGGVLLGRDDDHVWLKSTATSIEVYRKDSLVFEIEHRWNEEELSCDLLVDGQCYTSWQISQKAIGDLLFDFDLIGERS